MDDWKQDKQQTVTRLAICVVIAVVLYVVMDKFGDKLPLPDGWRPCLERNKIQAIAILAAILFGASLVLLPALQVGGQPQPPEDPDPCQGFQRTEE